MITAVAVCSEEGRKEGRHTRGEPLQAKSMQLLAH